MTEANRIADSMFAAVKADLEKQGFCIVPRASSFAMRSAATTVMIKIKEDDKSVTTVFINPLEASAIWREMIREWELKQ